MISEERRRAYLGAMQVDCWLPRGELPFAAPARAPWVAPEPDEPEPPPVAEVEARVARPAAAQVALRPRIALAAAGKTEEPARREESTAAPAPQKVPRFALQLLRAGACLLVVELPTGDAFQSRDPAYLLLKDLLRAARLPDKPQQVGDGEPIRWPLLNRGNLEQGSEAARDYVQGVIAAAREEADFACLWLIGSPALQFAAELAADAHNREVRVEPFGAALALPGLELLMEQPELKAELWRALRRSLSRWMTP
ncbi:energy transducer TonB [Stutzerimonas tarimensis]|uniref:Energy transducer TonB n=1 Tax=Stutzerimonas tarimensis TaxID=1507735 RepID=A0ABV7T2H0_9GAMM